MSLKLIVTACLITFLTSAGLAFAQVQDGNARVVVPDVRGGALVSGCYTSDRDLYGPYRITFCLKRRGVYAVRGDGLRCDGSLTWSTRGRDVSIALNRQSCNRRLAWAEASIVCRTRNSLDLLLDELLNKQKRNGDARVVVPENPTVGTLSCTYRPTVAGNRPTTFLATRQRT